MQRIFRGVLLRRIPILMLLGIVFHLNDVVGHELIMIMVNRLFVKNFEQKLKELPFSYLLL